MLVNENDDGMVEIKLTYENALELFDRLPLAGGKVAFGVFAGLEDVLKPEKGGNTLQMLKDEGFFTNNPRNGAKKVAEALELQDKMMDYD